jgi:PAS domain S-box-containing protein
MSGDTERILQRTLLGEALDLVEETAVFVWNDDRRYIAVNEHACTLVGLSRDELIGMPVGELSGSVVDENAPRLRRSPFRRGSSSFTRRDGEVVEIEWVTAHTRVAGLPCFVSVCWRLESGPTGESG